MSTTKKCVPHDLLPHASVINHLYTSEHFKSFIAELVGVPEVFPYADSLSGINVNYYDTGGSLSWHFDNAEFTVTLLIQASEDGGVFEQYANSRFCDDGSENYDLVSDILDNKVVCTSAAMCAGDLMVFRGKQSLHRVTTVTKGERVLVTLNYNQEPNVSLSETSRQTFFGRIQ
jgi:hypothetical protein